MSRLPAHQGTTRPDDGSEAWTTPDGLVLVTAPKAPSPYYRLEWQASDGRRRQTTAGRTFAKAWAKALAREGDLVSGATSRSEQPCSVGIAYWLDPRRPTPRGGWGESHRSNMEAYAKVYFIPTFGHVRSMDLRRTHFQQCVNAAPTPSEGRNIRRAASSLLGALRQGEYLLDNQVIDLANVFWHGIEVRRADVPGDSGELPQFVPVWKRPSNQQVEALRVAAERTGRRGQGQWWRGLMVELAAYAGPRWSELIALTETSVDPEHRKVEIHWRVAQPPGKPRRLAPPKMAKQRTTIYPEVSPTGYPLGEMMRRRIQEARRERRAGHNPKGLLFPATNGDWWWTGNFHRDLFEKSALAAGWKYTDRDNPYAGGTRRERCWELTWHSLRHTFCTVALEEWKLADSIVSLLAGHSDPNFTRTRYVGAAEDALDAAVAATSATAIHRARVETATEFGGASDSAAT
jgi:integrase